MATLDFGPMHTARAVSSTNFYKIGDAGPETVGSMTITVESASSLSFTVRGAVPGATLDTSSGQLQYSDLSTAGTVTGGSTAITTNGNYRVTLDGCAAGIHVTAGTGTLTLSGGLRG
jgi:hypothetical protein